MTEIVCFSLAPIHLAHIFIRILIFLGTDLSSTVGTRDKALDEKI